MAWLAVDKNGEEYIYDSKPYRSNRSEEFIASEDSYLNPTYFIYLPTGSIKKLIGKELTWNDEPVEI